MQLIDGRKTSLEIQDQIAKNVNQRKKIGKKIPHLATVLVGNNGASQAYVNAKIKACQRVGFKSSLIKLDENISETELLNIIEKLNHDTDIDGFIVQLPLPSHISEDKVTDSIHPTKDVDGFHPTNIGKMVLGKTTFLPATPYGIIQLLEHYKIETSGKNCVIIGRSNIVGTPMSLLMSRNANVGNCTVTLTHSRTKNIKEECLRADILIVALGSPEFITQDMVKQGAVVIDVGITRVADNTKKRGYALKGDVKFDEVAPKCRFITPVPGGVGPMTVTALLKNTLQASERNTA